MPPKQEKLPTPHDPSAERSTLGALALESAAYDTVSGIVRPEYFYDDRHRLIYQTIRAMYERGDGMVDVVTLRQELKRDKIFDECGGSSYLIEVLQSVPHVLNVEYYAKIVRDKWVLRNVIKMAESILREAYAGAANSVDVDFLLNRADKKIQGVLDTLDCSDTKTFSKVLDETFEAIFRRMDAESEVGLSTGIHGLDAKIGGFNPTQLIVLAARPAMGKTALVCNFALTVAKAKKAVMIFSLEQSQQEISERLLCINAQVNGTALRKGTLDGDAQSRLMETAESMRSLDLIIDEGPSRTMSQIASICRRQHRRTPLGLIIIDYLQLVEQDEQRQDRQQHIAATTRRLKFIAKELHVPVVVLSQLNRALENREDKRPKLSDLRESGAIEQDADSVIFLHRPEVYDPEDRPNEADLIVAKNRHGPIGTVPLVWMKEIMKFADKAAEFPEHLF